MTSYFTLEEFACKCKDKRCPGKEPQLQGNIQSTLLQALNRVREEFKKPITITSGFRCEAHNKAIGGAPGSQHRLGTAADIRPSSGDVKELERLYQLCLNEKAFTGVGDGRDKSFIHVDCRTSKGRKVWDYTPKTK